MAQVAITGNTYPVKDALKALGAKWDADRKCWTITDSKADRARKIVENAPAQKPATPGKCVKCGGNVKPPYHGVKRCSNCRDGGGNYNGGQSYYDRNGNFVLGDDD